jgi:DeoR/GlpR family transcriptional regulator of sugar metabolism
MTVEERRENILRIIEDKKKVSVSELKGLFNTSSVTIGNDLAALEKQGYIIKNFGYAEIRKAAVLSNDDKIENYEEKKRIAKHALKLIPDNSSVLLYTSNSVLILSRMIKEKSNINIVTNSFKIAHEVSTNLDARVIIMGGYYKMDNQSTFGEIAEAQLKTYNCDMLFFTANGVSASGGLTIDEPYERGMNLAMMESPMKKILLADGSKIGKTRFVPFSPVTAVDLIITDKSAPESEVMKIRELGVKIDVV